MNNDDITRYLSSLEREDCYRVDAVLKESPHELTQRVFFVGTNGAEQGPYVRKFIHRASGMGGAYERICDAQRNGKRLKHIPHIQECYQHGDFLVVVMEFVSGETLQDVVYRRNPSSGLAADVFPLLCDAATELHEAFDPPLIHRDLKPSNVMLSAGGLTIIDFGIARSFKESAESDTTKFGTRAFAPPEQFGFGQTTVRSDVYALGMLLYYCLTEKIPTSHVRDAQFQESDVPSPLRPVLTRATALDPDDRYASAAELKGAFLEAMTHLTGSNRKQKRRTPAIATATAAVLSAAVATCFFITTGTPSQPDVQDQPPTDSAQASERAGDTESAVLDGMQTSAPQRSGFDPATNIRATMAGVTFQIPSYFGAQTKQGENGIQYYYAESGSSLAMIMASESRIPRDADGSDASDGLESAKDSFLAGMVSSNEELFDAVIASTDCELAGYAARIVTLKGVMQNLPVTTKAVYFIKADTESDAYDIGALVFGQTGNVQLDCSADFAQVIASAVPASSTAINPA